MLLRQVLDWIKSRVVVWWTKGIENGGITFLKKNQHNGKGIFRHNQNLSMLLKENATTKALRTRVHSSELKDTTKQMQCIN